MQEEGQLGPVLEHVDDGFAQTRVGFDQPILDLPREPLVQRFHHRSALGLVQLQACLGRQVLFSRIGIVLVNQLQGFQDVAALLVKVLRHVDELATGVAVIPCPG